MKAILLQAAKASGSLILKKFNTGFSISHKEGINNLVTEVDQESERLITKIIKEHFPGHGIIGEEYGGQDLQSEYKWIVDPIDGTVNYAHGVPLCCVSIALMQHDEIIMGAVHNPMMNELFFAEKGKGAYLNDKKISVSDNDNFKKAFLVTGFPYNISEDEGPLTVFHKVVSRGLPVRRLGSAALDLCWVACGRFDGFWEYNLNAWDIAAGYLMVREAGGMISDFSGEKYSVWDKETLATNGKIHEALRRLIIAK